MAKRKKKRGRGRLSSIDLLPPECTPIIVWASEQLRDRDRTQLEIYDEFRAKLETLRAEHRRDFDIPSPSAFGRFSIRLAEVARRLETTREISGALATRFDARASDDLTLVASEAIKTLIFELTTDAGEAGIDPKGAMQLASALRNTAQAQGVSTGRRQSMAKEMAGQFDAAVGKVKREAGLTDKTIARLRREFLGVRAPEDADA